MNSLAGSDAEFFRNQPVEEDPIPTSDQRVACPRSEATERVRWDGNDGQGHDYWACEACGSVSHEVVSS